MPIKTTSNLETFEIEINEFNGPLDLLFSLIKERKFDILNIDLLYVSISYVEYVRRNIYKMKIDDITEYLSMITYFFELKSKKILSQTTDQDKLEDEMSADKFIQRVLLQKQFRELVPDLSKRLIQRTRMLSKDTDEIKIEDIVSEDLPTTISPKLILRAMQNIFRKLKPVGNDIINIEFSELSIDDVINDITYFLSKFHDENILLFDLLNSFPASKINKQYLAVTFVGLLVLVRNGNIALEQDIENDNDIRIRKMNLE
ncbi:MAG: segregation and condensation protein A [Mycoplasmoidaceae bacterium]